MKVIVRRLLVAASAILIVGSVWVVAATPKIDDPIPHVCPAGTFDCPGPTRPEWNRILIVVGGVLSGVVLGIVAGRMKDRENRLEAHLEPRPDRRR